MADPEALAARRRVVLGELASLAEVRRGSVVEQYVEAVGADGQRRRRGPYPLYTRKDKRQKTVARRLKSAAEVTAYRRQIEGFRRFQRLVAELLTIGEQLSDQAAATGGPGKKTTRRRQSRTPRSSAF